MEKSNTMHQMIKLLLKLQMLKPFAICALLECDRETSEEISAAFDNGEFIVALALIESVSEESLVRAAAQL